MSEFWRHLPGVWVSVMTLVAFVTMGWDKLCARRHWRRVPERRLFLLAALGGSIGSIAGMYAFRHKTRHWYFKWGLPGILLLQIAACAAWFYFR